MNMNPIKALSARMSDAVDWRVDRAFDQRSPRKMPEDARLELDRNTAEIAALRALLANISSSLSDQDRALGELVEQLDRRIQHLEP